MTSKTFKIGEVAELLNVTIRTIRYYEEENLLNPDRTSGGTRVYTEQHIARLRAIIYLTENDFSLEVIRLIGSSRQTCSTGDEGSEKISSIMTYLNKELDEKIGQLENLKSELTA
ncbi:Transcriptional regulator, MerR family, partial [hydrothermal vent metagenome]